MGLRGGDGGGNQRQSGAEEHGEIGEEEKAFMNPNTPLHLLRERDSFAIFHYTFYLTPASQPPSGSISSSIITRCFYVDKFLPAPHHAARRLENACVRACARFVLPFSTLGGKFSLPLLTATHTHTHTNSALKSLLLNERVYVRAQEWENAAENEAAARQKPTATPYAALTWL